MKNRTILLFIILFIFCLSQKQTAQTLNGHWSLICYSNLLTGKQDCLTVTDESQTVSLEFKDNGKTGTMSGHTTTNDVTGDYIISDNNKIKVKNFGGTKVGELPWIYDFWTTISQSSSFKFNGDTLVILFDNDTKAMKFRQLKKINNNDITKLNKTKLLALTHAYVHRLADVHFAGFAPAFPLSFHDRKFARKPPAPIASVVRGSAEKNAE